MPKALRLALVSLCFLTWHAHLGGQQFAPYTSNVNSCITEQFYNSKKYGWYTYSNNCTTPIKVTWVSRDGLHAGALEIPGEKSRDIGMNEREVDAMGGVLAYACQEHYNAVDARDRNITKPVDAFRCKYQGY